MAVSRPDVMSTLAQGSSRVIAMHDEISGELLAEYASGRVESLGLTATPAQVKTIVARVVSEHGEFTTIEKFCEVARRVLA